MLTLFQVSGDLLSNIIWFIFLMIFFYFYPRIMVFQTLSQLEGSARKIEDWTASAKNIVTKKISRNPSKEVKEKINNFLEFFAIEPVNLDPYGIIRKIEHISDLSEKRFKYFVKDVAPRLNKEEQDNLMMALSATVSLNQVAKMVRHVIETVRKTNNIQLAMLLQMQLAMIEKISKSLLSGAESMANGWPIGDGTGALVAAQIIGNNRAKKIEEDVLLVKKRIKGRNVLIMKSQGPGGTVGKLGKAVEKIMKREKVSKIITVDAAAKLEGEKTGSIAEGVGVAIGGIGVDRAYIEDLAVKHNIPLDTVVIKMSQEQALEPMNPKVLAAVPKVVKILENNLAKSHGKVLLVGVGNTCGKSNNQKDAAKSEKKITEVARIMKERKKREKKGFMKSLFGEKEEED